jgi:hypothetical protein
MSGGSLEQPWESAMRIAKSMSLETNNLNERTRNASRYSNIQIYRDVKLRGTKSLPFRRNLSKSNTLGIVLIFAAFIFLIKRFNRIDVNRE